MSLILLLLWIAKIQTSVFQLILITVPVIRDLLSALIMTADIRVSVTKDGFQMVRVVVMMNQNADLLTTVMITLSAQMLTVAFHVPVGTDSADLE